MIERADSNGDGKITPEDFQHVMTKVNSSIVILIRSSIMMVCV
jgi:hypothetical protein